MGAPVKFTDVRVLEPIGRRRRTVRKPWAHDTACECEPEHTFVCAQCGRVVGWCMGAADNMPEACDDCWFEAAS